MSEAARELPVTSDQMAEAVQHAADSGEITYLTRAGRRLAAVVPVDIAERAEADEDAWLSRLADEARAADDGTRLSHEQVMAELGIELTDEDLAAARARLGR